MSELSYNKKKTATMWCNKPQVQQNSLFNISVPSVPPPAPLPQPPPTNWNNLVQSKATTQPYVGVMYF